MKYYIITEYVIFPVLKEIINIVDSMKIKHFA